MLRLSITVSQRPPAAPRNFGDCRSCGFAVGDASRQYDQHIPIAVGQRDNARVVFGIGQIADFMCQRCANGQTKL